MRGRCSRWGSAALLLAALPLARPTTAWTCRRGAACLLDDCGRGGRSIRRQEPTSGHLFVASAACAARRQTEDASEQILGGVRARLRPDVESASLAVSAEFALAPLAQKAAEGQETQPIGERDDLLAHVDSASGEKFQHTTSVHRAFASAQTHPLVDTAHASVRSSVGRVFQERVLDERGRAIAGEQGELALSVGLPAFSVEFAAGVAAKNIAESMVALWRCPEGPDWTEGAERAARQVILDLAELGGAPAFPSRRERGASASAAAGAASGASASGPSMGVPFFVDWNAIARERGGGGCRGRVFVWVRRGGGRAARRCLWRVAIPPPASGALSRPRRGVAGAAGCLALQQEQGEVSAEASVGVDRRFDEAGVLSRPESERVPNWNPARERQRCAERQVFFRGARARVDQGPLPWRAEKTPRRRGL